MRSAKAPTISAGVMMAKVIWKVMNTDSGMVPGEGVHRHAGQERLVQATDPLVERAAIASKARL